MISEHISIKEATFSSTATRKGIDNTPNATQIENMKLVATKVFEPLRKHFNTPIGISSFFRSEALNKAIGGSASSQHCKGEAIDIDADIFGGVTNGEIFKYIKENLEFDQLIWEYGNTTDPDWVHVSYSKSGNRRQILKAIKVGGKTTYVKP